MTREQAIEVLHNALYGGGNAFVMSEFRDAIKLALGTLKQERVPEDVGTGTHHFLPSNLDEAAEAYEKYAMEDYDEICVNEDGSECPVLKCDFKDAFKAGAEWMAGQFQKIEGYLVDWYSTSDGKDYCCGIKTDEAFEIPEGFYIRKKQ